MKVLIVFNHPYEGSFCNAILQAVQTGLKNGNHQVEILHLDKDNFDPVMRGKDLQAFALARKNPQKAYELLDEQVQSYHQKLSQADHLIFIFPIWWELMPALTKGFIDKVIFPSLAYQYQGESNRMTSLLKLSGVTMISTMATPSWLYKILFGNAIYKALLLGTFWKIGVKNRRWFNFAKVKEVGDDTRQGWLKTLEQHFSQHQF